MTTDNFKQRPMHSSVLSPNQRLWKTLVVFFLSVFLISSTVRAFSQVVKSDLVIVKKAERVLLLMRDNRVLHSFPISLGDVPEGDKMEAGDWRTPEGRYVIDWRNDRSRFYKALHISYPNADDRRTAAALGVDPGGMIMIHGLPPEAETNPQKYAQRDWTEGCIALKNSDMDVVWAAVVDGTPIEILP